MKQPLAPILVYEVEHISLAEAARYVERHPDTVRRWCKQYRIARPSKGATPLKIHKPALAMIMHDDFIALAALRRGDYNDDQVARYYAFAGVPLP